MHSSLLALFAATVLLAAPGATAQSPSYPDSPRKMAARVQAASTSGRPVLLRVNFDTGHGQGTGLDQRVEENADTYAFLMSQLEMN